MFSHAIQENIHVINENIYFPFSNSELKLDFSFLYYVNILILFHWVTSPNIFFLPLQPGFWLTMKQFWYTLHLFMVIKEEIIAMSWGNPSVYIRRGFSVYSLFSHLQILSQLQPLQLKSNHEICKYLYIRNLFLIIFYYY